MKFYKELTLRGGIIIHAPILNVEPKAASSGIQPISDIWSYWKMKTLRISR
jgi:hypothetical protein